MIPYGNFDFWENIMKISELVKIVDATVYAPSNKDVEGEIMGAFASDMMSDVLAFAKNQDVLISGLCNPQTVRTAVMLDMKIQTVRGQVFKAMEKLRKLDSKDYFLFFLILYLHGVSVFK